MCQSWTLRKSTVQLYSASASTDHLVPVEIIWNFLLLWISVWRSHQNHWLDHNFIFSSPHVIGRRTTTRCVDPAWFTSECCSVWSGLFVWTVGWQCPSHLCVDYAPFTLLYLLFIYRSVWKKNTQLHGMQRDTSVEEFPNTYIFDPEVLKQQWRWTSITQCVLVDKRMNKAFEKDLVKPFWVIVLNIFFIYSMLCT